MKILLHACCGPCACYPTAKMELEGKEFDILFYNPNIHPYKEFKQRLHALTELCRKKEYNLIVDKSYPLEQTLEGMVTSSGGRCGFCYKMRMRYTAAFAKEYGYDCFSTTLLVSPYQRHELLKAEAEKAAAEFGVPFLYEDFRKGFEQGTEMSIALGLYRQQYCGCVFSERDRYEPVKKNREVTFENKLTRISKHLSMVNHD
ncbi:MAG: epoxyqueuosine reductase QueH [Acidaminococcaceae bacterium]|nr:epoxyqueuosine reductase QueH [Acidaminococcaceae bacterium]